MKLLISSICTSVVLMMIVGVASAKCQINDDGKLSDFDGKSLAGLEVEKKSLIALDKEFKDLHAMEKSFAGELKSCTPGTDKCVVCN